MTQIPLLSGIRATPQADFEAVYPINLEPIIIDTGIAQGYLKFCAGTTARGTGPGTMRGSINWNGVVYAVMGSKLVRVGATGNAIELGEVGDNGLPVSLDYSFDYLSIGSNGNLFYWDPVNGLRQVTDPDLGTVVDHIFIDGYNMTTDGEFLVVTELNDPMQVDPLKYGSSESDPDPVTGLIPLSNEVYALNRYSIDVFQNVGGNGFPFAVIPGAVIPRGCVSRSAKCLIGESGVFVGGGRNEALGVYQIGAGQSQKLSTREIDEILAQVPDPTQIVLEGLSYGDQQRLLIHLPDKTLVFLPEASSAAKELVWYIRQGKEGVYRPRFFTPAYGVWTCGDASGNEIGTLDNAATTDFGDVRPWQLTTRYIYNESRGAIVHSVELVGLPGRTPFGEAGVVFFSRSLDGETWGEERAVPTGAFGQRGIRVQHRPHWRMSNYLAIRCRGNDLAHAGWARMEAQIEPLGV